MGEARRNEFVIVLLDDFQERAAARFAAIRFRPLRMKANCISGTTNTATNRDVARMMEMPTGNHFTKSFIKPVIVSSSGKNVMLMASVALKMDEKNSFAAADAACQWLMPASIFSM